MWLAKDNRLLNPKSSYERILTAPPCRLIFFFWRCTILSRRAPIKGLAAGFLYFLLFNYSRIFSFRNWFVKRFQHMSEPFLAGISSSYNTFNPMILLQRLTARLLSFLVFFCLAVTSQSLEESSCQTRQIFLKDNS